MQHSISSIHIFDLPLEVLHVIATHTPIRDVIGAMRGTCQRWYTFLSGDLFCRWALVHCLQGIRKPRNDNTATVRVGKRARVDRLPHGVLLARVLQQMRRLCVQCRDSVATRLHPVYAVRVCAVCAMDDRYRLVAHGKAKTLMHLLDTDLCHTALARSATGTHGYWYRDLCVLVRDKYGDTPEQWSRRQREQISGDRNLLLDREANRVKALVKQSLKPKSSERRYLSSFWSSDLGRHSIVIRGDHRRSEQFGCVSRVEDIVRKATEYAHRRVALEREAAREAVPDAPIVDDEVRYLVLLSRMSRELVENLTDESDAE